LPRVLGIFPALNGIEGGSGYTILPTEPNGFQHPTSKSGDWFLATG
jgi:hypothetical protein